MTNRQWLIWQMIEMSDETLAHRLDVEWFCDNYCDGENQMACDSNCRENMIEWLKQEHKENSNEL
jgi:hypothetical protein